jgi:ribonuclease T1
MSAGHGGWRQWLRAATGAARAASTAVVVASAALAAQARVTPDSVPTVALAELPPEARQTKQLILAGGPFPYSKDGTVFFNRERLLPPQRRGFYREYTVTTPGARNRGARRIVCGGEVPTAPEACYYTADHYASFRRIVVVR